MDSVKRSEVTPGKSRFGRSLAKILSIKSLSGISQHGETEKKKSDEKAKKEQAKNGQILSFGDDDEDLQNALVREAFLAKLFASMSAIKAAYAQLQLAQSPYDGDGIQLADQMVVSELKNLSELKQAYLKQHFNDASPETTLLLSEIEEQKSVIKTYEITSKKLDSQLKLKDSEITFLKEKLAEVNKDCKSLEKRLKSSGQIAVPDNAQLSSLMPRHFITCFRQAVKSIRSFVQFLINEMESAGWDLDAATSSIEPEISFWNPSQKCYAFESYVCKQMLDGFNFPNFSNQTDSIPEQENRRRLFFDTFMELKSVRPADYLAWKPKSTFATFCRNKYSKLVHPKMEASLFGNLNTRDSVNSGEFPETPFFLAFIDMAKRVWLLHCLAFSFDPVVSIFQVSKGTRFSEVYMESLSDEAFLSSDAVEGTNPRVAFTVVPGFRIGKTVVQSQVYLS